MLTVTKRDGTTWQMEKRYSEFDELNNTLKKVGKGSVELIFSCSAICQHFPGKRSLSSRNTLISRREELGLITS
jgi:hypothetical protein